MRVIAGETKPDSGEVFRPAGAVYTRLTQEVPTDVVGTVHDLVSSGLRSARAHEEDWERDVRLENLIERLQLRGDRRVFHTLGRAEKARPARPGPRGPARPAPPRRADQPPRHRVDPLAGGVSPRGKALPLLRHPRPGVSAQARHADRRAGPRPALELGLRLRHLPGAQAGGAGGRGAQPGALRQEARPGGGLDPARASGPSGRGPRAGSTSCKQMRAERAARRERTGNGGLKLAEAERSGVKVIDRRECRLLLAGRPAARPRADDDDHARRQDRAHRAERRGKDDPDQAAPRPDGADRGDGRARDQPRGRVLRPAPGPDRRLEDGRRQHRQRQPDGDDRRADPERDQLSAGFPLRPGPGAHARRVLSGGERNRLLLARLFTKPANVLVMDEPTNDLDAETLDLLEDLLVEYAGTLLLVSHDREFLDEVVTSTLVFEGDGRIGDYVGRLRRLAPAAEAPEASGAGALPSPPGARSRRAEGPQADERREAGARRTARQDRGPGAGAGRPDGPAGGRRLLSEGPRGVRRLEGPARGDRAGAAGGLRQVGGAGGPLGITRLPRNGVCLRARIGPNRSRESLSTLLWPSATFSRAGRWPSLWSRCPLKRR